MQFFHQGGGQDYVSDKGRLNDQDFLHGAKMQRNYFTPPPAG
jgi:hypothetical protein